MVGGGKGVRIDYRIKSDNPSTGSRHRAWLTVAYTRCKVPPWPLKGGQPGSPNHILIVRANGETERHSVVSGWIGAAQANREEHHRRDYGSG
jgi:N-methylhydantoinase B